MLEIHYVSIRDFADHWRVVPVNIPMTILHRTMFDPLKMIIWALNVFRWLSGSSTPEKGWFLVWWSEVGSTLPLFVVKRVGGYLWRTYPGSVPERCVVHVYAWSCTTLHLSSIVPCLPEQFLPLFFGKPLPLPWDVLGWLGFLLAGVLVRLGPLPVAVLVQLRLLPINVLVPDNTAYWLVEEPHCLHDLL